MTALRDKQCPDCRAWFRTANSTKKFCSARCQQRHKQQTRAARATQRDFRLDFQDQHRRNSGADASRRAALGPPQVDWAPILERFREDMSSRYGDEQ